MNGVYYTRRRGSIFGGLLLMVIGTLFLIHYLAPGVLHLGQLARYWPVLLILWGLARLWDHFAATRRGQAPPRTVSGGDLLLVLLVLVGIVALLSYDRLHRNMGWDDGFNLFGNPYTFTATLPTTAVDPLARIDLWTPRGNITVRPREDKNLSIVVTKTVRASDQAEAQKVADATTVSVQQTPQVLHVEPKIPSGADDAQVSYDVSVFPKTSLTASTGRGQIHVNGIDGELSLSTSGDVDVQQTGSNITLDLRRGDARVHSVAGNVTINGRGQQVDVGEIAGQASINGEFYGPIHVRRIAKAVQFNSSRTALSVSSALGRLDMESGDLVLSDTPGNVSLETRDKDVQFENVQGNVAITDRNGNVDIRYSEPPTSNITITNRSGDISIALPARSSFSITAVARSGDISNDFETPALHLVETSPNAQLQGTVGTGGPKITLNTSYGTIHVLRAPSMPPVPSPAPTPKPGPAKPPVHSPTPTPKPPTTNPR
ncbi:MAG: DUF4097 family beta strand repeat protein [Acidobacteriota bacterium]|nr:DUF4097 family beta strand repeat protein [Acidobacteriota bacterium]